MVDINDRLLGVKGSRDITAQLEKGHPAKRFDRSLRFIDADTLHDINNSDNRYRLYGVQGEETWKVNKNGLQRREAGAAELTGQTAAMARQYGFNKIREMGREDKYGRKVVDLVDDAGRSFSDFLVQTGIQRGVMGVDNTENYQLNSVANLMQKKAAFEELSSKDQARLLVQNAIRSESGDTRFKLPAANPAEAGAYNYLRGDKNKSRINNEIKDLQTKMLETPDPQDRAAIKAQMDALTQELHYISTLPDVIHGSDVHIPGRSMENESYNQLTDSFLMGLTTTAQTSYAALEAIGSFTGIKKFEEWGAEGVARKDELLGKYGSVLIDWDDIDGVGDFFQWTGNNLAMTAPFMAVAAGSALATGGAASVAVGAGLMSAGTGAAVAFGAGAVPSWYLGVGEIYNSMEGEKNAGFAIAGGFFIGLLERLPFGGKFTKGMIDDAIRTAGANGWSTKQLSEELMERAVDAYAETHGGREVAEAFFKAKGPDFQMEYLKAIGKFSTGMLKAQNVSKRVLARVAKQSGAEAATELAQTAVETGAAVAGSEAVFNPEEFKKNLITATIVGGIYGGGFTTRANLKDYSLAHVLSRVDQGKVSDRVGTREREEGQAAAQIQQSPETKLKSTETFVHDIAPGNASDAEAAVKRAQAVRKDKTYTETVVEGVSNFGGLINSKLMTAIDGIKKAADGSLNLEALVYGQAIKGTRGAVTEGNNMWQQAQSDYGDVMATIYSEEDVAGQMGTSTARQAFNEIREAVDQNYAGPGKTLEIPESHPKAEQINHILKTYRDATARLQQLAEAAGYTREAELLKDPDYFINNVVPKFVTMTAKDYQSLRDSMIGLEKKDGLGSPMDIDVANDVIEELQAGRDQSAMNILQKYKMSKAVRDHFQMDVGAAISRYTESITQRMHWDKNVGANLEKAAGLADFLVRNEKVTQEQADQFLLRMAEIKQEMEGMYGAWDSTGIQWVQDNLLEWTMYSSLPMAALASAPEIPLTQLGVPPHLWWNDLAAMAKPVAKAIVGYGSFVTGGRARQSAEAARLERDLMAMTPKEKADRLNNLTMEEAKDSAGLVNQFREEMSQLRAPVSVREAGYGQQQSDVLSRINSQQRNERKRVRMLMYVKYIGLDMITNMARGLRLVKASQVFEDYISTLEMSKIEGNPAQEEAFLNSDSPVVQNALMELRRKGVPVERALYLRNKFLRFQHAKEAAINNNGTIDKELQMKPKEIQEYRSILKDFSIKFTDDAIVNPHAGSVPGYYKHQKLAAFNQFNGFMANFQATVLPNIAAYLTSRGTAFSYATLNMAVSMLAASFLAYAIRDLIKYGESALDKEYLDEYEYWRRAVGGTALLGVAERIWNIVDPMYEDRSDSTLEKIANTVLGEAAMHRTVTNAASGLTKIGEGWLNDDPETLGRGVGQASKTIPVFGSVNQAREGGVDILKDFL